MAGLGIDDSVLQAQVCWLDRKVGISVAQFIYQMNSHNEYVMIAPLTLCWVFFIIYYYYYYCIIVIWRVSSVPVCLEV